MSNPARSELKPSSVQFCRPRLEALELLNILRDNELSYGDYVEQLTFLLFPKMADEQARPPFNKPAPIEGLEAVDSVLRREPSEWKEPSWIGEFIRRLPNAKRLF